jgi:hypothetical protein
MAAEGSEGFIVEDGAEVVQTVVEGQAQGCHGPIGAPAAQGLPLGLCGTEQAAAVDHPEQRSDPARLGEQVIGRVDPEVAQGRGRLEGLVRAPPGGQRPDAKGQQKANFPRGP